MYFHTDGEFKALIGRLPVGVLVQGPGAEILVNNQAACDLLGITEDQLLGKTSFDPDWNVIHEDGSPFPGPTHPVPQAIATRKAVMHVVMGVYRPARKDRVWLLVDAIPHLNDDGNLRDVVCTFSDITESRRKDAAITEILKAVPDQLIRLKRDGTFLFFQPARTVPSFFNADAVTGKTIYDLFPPFLVKQTLHLIENAIESGEVQIWDYQSSSTGKMIEREIRVVAMTEDEVLVILRDVTAEKRAERDHLELERARLLRNFIDNISHDFRTPITILKTSLYLLSKQVDNLTLESRSLKNEIGASELKTYGMSQVIIDGSSEIQQRIGIMEATVERLKELSESMTDVVRLDQEYHYHFEAYDLNQLARLTVNELMPQALNHQQTLRLETRESQLQTLVDITMMGRAIKHLIENAIEYTPAYGKIVIRTYRADQDSDHGAVIEVEDNGKGISLEDLPHVFERFYRGDKSRSGDVGGAGLGLAIAKEIVEAHRGKLEVSTHPGKGSVFTIIL
ncbi:MAG TPA: ATP-binding protein [Phototrophicaceae bacterium]|jgi:PAS domain S-box-containing protein|nr:ATP-binding protein [Phototrophicaceae bacterium]